MKTQYAVHPAADVWPMANEVDLRRMADTIKEHGLKHPIVLSKDKMILDGRNRLAACEIAGVEPTFVKYDGDDLVTYILLTNERRDMTLQQKAATTALSLGIAEARKNGRWLRGTVPNISEDKANDNVESYNSNLWRCLMRDAGFILDHAKELLDQVRDKRMAFDAALKEAQSRCDEKENAIKFAEEQRRVREGLPADLRVLVETGQLSLDHAVRRAKLPKSYADRVMSGGLSIDEAEALLERDTKERRDALKSIAASIHTFLCGVDVACSISRVDNPNRDDVLKTLSDLEREQFLSIERVLHLQGLDKETREMVHDTMTGRLWDVSLGKFRTEVMR